MRRLLLAALSSALAGTAACSDDATSATEPSGDGGSLSTGGASGTGNGGTAATAGAGGTQSTGGVAAGAGGTSTGGAGGVPPGSGGAGGALQDGGVSGTSIDGGAGGRRLTESPWGVAPSHSSSVGISSWASEIAATGVDWIRGFDAGNAATVLQVAQTNGFQVSGIYFFSDPGPDATFPINSIPQFGDYVTNTVRATRDKIHHWEVWNEPPNFSANKSPIDYAEIVVAAYDATKAEDATVQVGLAVQSVNLNFMAQALDAGAAGHFDYVTVHPYETMGLVDDGWEAEYMSIVPTIRKLLADKDPTKKDVPVWFTEVGEPVQGSVTPEHQADTLVKAYVMGIAQGALRVHWFEPLDGDSGPFGLIGGSNGSAPKRPSYTAVSKLIELLGHHPAYVGWVWKDGAYYAFVFEGLNGPVMVAWSPKGVTSTFDLGATARILNPGSGTTSDAATYALTHSPVLVTGFTSTLVQEARANFARPFPWGGDYSALSSASYTAGDTQPEKGLHPVGQASIVTIDGSPARNVSQGPAQAFTIDPNFCSYSCPALEVTAVLRRNGTDSAGFNLKYESTTDWKGTGSWYTIPGSDQWYTQTWTITDTQFVGKWGYNFAFDSDSTQYSNYSIRSVTVTKR
jgi:hypothetical protein